MRGTNYASGGSPHPTQESEPLRPRLVGFVVAVSFGALIIAWIDTSIWHRMRELERGLAAVKTERFYHGVQIRLDLQHLNDALLEFQLRGDQEALKRFLEDGARLRHRITRLGEELASPREQEIVAALRKAFLGYLNHTAKLQERSGLFGPSRRKVDEVHDSLGTMSQPIFALCEELIQVQREEFGVFLAASQSMLDGFQSLITASIVLLVVLAVSVVVLVYRGMIMPLRLRLSESEAAIVRQEKLAALGTLAAGVAHEIRNPLTAIKFRLFSLRKALPAAMAHNEDTSVIEEEIDRLERIVKDFIQFARPSDPQWVDAPVSRILDEVRSLMSPELEAVSIPLTLQVTHDMWLRVDPQQLKQVMINLVQNAMESIETSGTITLGAVRDHATLGGARRPVAVITVTDTGKGIPPEARSRLFDPFFTTKDGGTGLGLAMASRVIDTLGGQLHYHTQLHRGTTFRIVLPRIEPPAA